MYKITRQNNSIYKVGQLVPDKEYNEEVRRLIIEGAVPAVAMFLPDYRWKVYNRLTGEVSESLVKRSSSESALRSALNFAIPRLGREGILITVTEDGTPELEVDLRYV